MNLGKAITLSRSRRGLTQAELAKRAGISVSYLSLLEQNKRTDPTLSTIQKLSEALGVPTGVLFFLAAEQKELAGLDSDLQQKLALAALNLLDEQESSQRLL
jgi:transcriptional regulator with XRE-family HTH domain